MTTTINTRPNEAGCRNAGDPRTPALTLLAGARGQVNQQQATPAHAATGLALATTKLISTNITCVF